MPGQILVVTEDFLSTDFGSFLQISADFDGILAFFADPSGFFAEKLIFLATCCSVLGGGVRPTWGLHGAYMGRTWGVHGAYMGHTWGQHLRIPDFPDFLPFSLEI
jgi:hypothetical protein